MRSTLALIAALLLATGCRTPISGDETASPNLPVTDAWATVDAKMQAAFTAQGIPGMGLTIRDRSDKVVFQRMYGDFTAGRKVAIASASKWVSGLVLFELIRQGKLSLDDTTGGVLGWTGPHAAITLRHLLSFTSGLPNYDLCTANILSTLERCVAEIESEEVVAAPGTRFDYGSTHLHVAGRMAEVRTGKKWNDLFREILGNPLGLSEDVLYFAGPRSSSGRDNPLVAGGLRASMDDYAKFVTLVMHDGQALGLTIGTAELYAAQAKEPFPGVTVGNSPARDVGHDFHYGLAAWLECTTPASGCTTIGSPGAFGFTPWIDRKAGYTAILGMELSGTDGGVVKFSVDLGESLKPDIEKALSVQ